jgi:hypothetical protein
MYDASKIRVETRMGIMDTLINRMKTGRIDLSPAPRRLAEVWNEMTRSRFIESLILRIPTPSFCFDTTNLDRWTVIDGLERLYTVSRFVVEGNFALQGLEFLPNCNGKKFSETPRNFRRNIADADITMVVIGEGTPDDIRFALARRFQQVSSVA